MRLEEIKTEIEHMFYQRGGRIDAILLPTGDDRGVFFVVYTVEYSDNNNISSVKLAEGIYEVRNDNVVITVNAGGLKVSVEFSGDY